jgi:ParB-like chromosome segregation protein Spo0J
MTSDAAVDVGSPFPRYKRSSVAELIPYARNARTHSETQMAQIAASIREFGFTNPILVDGARGVIAGHGRLLAARKLGLDEVPTIELSHLTPAQRRAYVLADNRLALPSPPGGTTTCCALNWPTSTPRASTSA